MNILSVIECLQVLQRALNEASRLLLLCLRRKGKLRIQIYCKIQVLGQTGFSLSSTASFVAFVKCRGLITDLCSPRSVQLLFQIFVDCSCTWVLCVVLFLFLRCVQFLANMSAIVFLVPDWIYVTCLGLKGQIKVIFIQTCDWVQAFLSAQNLCMVVL